MTENLRATLIAEVGSVVTRVTLVDLVDGEVRLIGRAATPSTIEPPYQNALYGILEGAAQISELTGRWLLRDGQLLMPQSNERDGINHLLVTSSATGPLSLVVTAIASDISAQSAIRATRCTYTSLLQVITLDDVTHEATATAAGDERSWIERQVETLLTLQPDVVLIAGGLEEGAVDAVSRLAHIVSLTALTRSRDPNGRVRPEEFKRTVIYAGNTTARERVIATLADRTRLLVVDNLRPTLEHEQLQPTRSELLRLYDELVLNRLPGISGLRRLTRTPITTVCSGSGLITRFFAERYQRRVLTVDVGATSTLAIFATPGEYYPAVLGIAGTGYGSGAILARCGPAALARWLPFPIDEVELTHRLLNKLLRPHVEPVTREEVALENAVAREALALAYAALCEEHPQPDYDLVIAGGSVLAGAPHPAYAALAILDALQPTADKNALAIELHLDTLGLVPACGALAMNDSDAAITVFERDLLQNIPLATCVVAIGTGAPGTLALEAELETTSGRRQKIQVGHGQIARLALEPRKIGKLTLRPAPGVRIGSNPPGAEVSSNVGAIRGSILGVVIDARGRPLRLPADEQQRCVQQWEWLVALGAERGANPYLSDAPQPANIPQPQTVEPAGLNGTSRPAPEPLAVPPVTAAAAATPPPPPPPAVETSLPAAPAEEPAPPPAELETPPVPVPAAPAEEPAPPPAELETPPVPVPAPTPEPAAAQDPATTGEVGSEGISEPDLPKKGRRISLDELAAAEENPAPNKDAAPASAADPGVQDDLASLRESVEKPKKRGWFGRE